MPFVTIGSARFFYRGSIHKTSAERPALIFLHGSGGDSSVWEKQIQGLDPYFTVIAPDLPGHGYTKGPLCTSAQEYAARLAAFAAEVQLGNFFLAGHSLGGAIAQECARILPHKVQGLILAGCGTHFIIAPEYREAVSSDFPAAVKASCQAAFSPENVSLFYARGCEMLSRNGGETLSRDMAACAEFNSSPWISSIAVPACIICGSDDTITPPAVSEELARLITNSTLKIVAGAGHMVMMETPVEFNEAIKEFIVETAEITDGLCDLKQSSKMKQPI